MTSIHPNYFIRLAKTEDIAAIIEICKAIYPNSVPWSEKQLKSHQNIFPEGQLIAETRESGKVIGMAASLIVFWDDYEWTTPWRNFTAEGMFTNHDPVNGKTLYGAEIMVHPAAQGIGVGKLLYKARERIAEKFKLHRIRAGARLQGYAQYANKLTADQYVKLVIEGNIIDKTLSFQLRKGFRVLKVISNYLRHDPESLGYAAVIEWINPEFKIPVRY